MWVRGMSTREAYIWMYSVMRKYSAMLTHHKHDSAELINNMGELPVLPSIRRYSHIRALKVYFYLGWVCKVCFWVNLFYLIFMKKKKVLYSATCQKFYFLVYKPSTSWSITSGLLYVVFYQSSFQALIRNGKTPVIGISSSNVFIIHMVEKLTWM